MSDNRKVVSRSHKAALAVLEELDLQRVVKNVDEDIRGMVVHKLTTIIESATTATDLHLESRLTNAMFNAAMQQLPDTVHDAISPHADAVVYAMDEAARRYLGDGPWRLDAMQALNQVGQQAGEKGLDYSFGYRHSSNQYTVGISSTSATVTVASDVLSDAIRHAQSQINMLG